MEFIANGERLTSYANRHKLNVRDRLELICGVCDAVHHAHQRGIIHRDLKPANILVDDRGQPKILDFGVARITDSDTQATRQTDLGQLIGTLAYMSPEQVVADPLAIDIRSDVYALGVILYELLAGKLPYDTSRNKLHEVVQVICEEDAAPLSSIERSYRGDIETIVAKALEKDKTRRYASAADLASDIRRHLEDRPILARPATTAYQLRKFTRRHRALVFGTVAVFVALVAGIIASTWEAARARHAQTQALQEAAKSKAVNEFLRNMLASADPFGGDAASGKQGREVTVAQKLADAIRNLDRGDLNKQPLVEAAVRLTIGNALDGIGDTGGAETQIRKALEIRRAHLPPVDPEIAEALQFLAEHLQVVLRASEAEALMREALAVRRKVFGNESREVAKSEASLSMMIPGSTSERLALIEDAVALSRKLNVEDRDQSDYLATLGNAYLEAGRFTEAETAARKAVEMDRRVLGAEHPSVAVDLVLLTMVLNAQRKFAEAELVAREALAIYRKALGDHLRTARAGVLLADALAGQRRFSESDTIRADSIDMIRRVMGEGPAVAVALQRWTLRLIERGRLAPAEQRIQEAIAILRNYERQPTTDLAFSLSTLGVIRYKQGRFSEAETLDRDSLARRRRLMDDSNAFVVNGADLLGEDLIAQRKFNEAEQLYRELLAANHQKTGTETNVRVLLSGLGEALLEQHRAEEAEPLLREAVQIGDKQHRAVERPQGLLGAVLVQRGRFTDAEPLLLTSQKSISADSAASAQTKRRAIQRIVELYDAWDKSAPNAAKAAEAARWRALLRAQPAR
jgi:tetratricopeptide (TPR) repeat protein